MRTWLFTILFVLCVGTGQADMATLVSDDFNGSDNTNIQDHTPDTDYAGWGWGEVTNTWEIQSNQLECGIVTGKQIK